MAPATMVATSENATISSDDHLCTGGGGDGGGGDGGPVYEGGDGGGCGGWEGGPMTAVEMSRLTIGRVWLSSSFIAFSDRRGKEAAEAVTVTSADSEVILAAVTATPLSDKLEEMSCATSAPAALVALAS